MKRIFHPVGQGAFYSETHNNLNIVYDCGNWHATKKSKNIVKQAFNKTDVIDILFISHFDYDHVSLIPTLKEAVKLIKVVVMPLMSEQDIIILSSINKMLKNGIAKLIVSPEKYFFEETKIIKIKPTESNEPIGENEEIIFIDNDELVSGIEVNSGAKITTKTNRKDWVFIPYNFNYDKRRQDLIKLFNDKNVNLKNLGKKDTAGIREFTIDEICNDIEMPKKEGGKLFKEIYDQLVGGVNINSMIVYSGPPHILQDNKKEYRRRRMYYNNQYFPYYPIFRDIILNNKPACIYTGDANLNVTKIYNIFNHYWSNIGTIQIPHHGSRLSFDINQFQSRNGFACPISVNNINHYGHPSTQVIADLIETGHYPIKITDNPESLYIEFFQYKQFKTIEKFLQFYN